MKTSGSVYLSCSSLTEHPATSPNAYSGILIARDLVLTHGSVLSPILTRSRRFLEFVGALIPGELTPSRILLEHGLDLSFRVYRDEGSLREGRRSTEETSGDLVAIWKCPLLKETFDSSFESWNFEYSGRFERLLLSVFVVIDCAPANLAGENLADQVRGEEGSKLGAKIERALIRLAKEASGSKLGRGSQVEIVSTPFGNPLFADSLARGVVGNLFGVEDCLLLLDANVLPGCEGGPIYLIDDCNRRVICGMVIASLSWCRDEWVDYTFAVNFSPALKQIIRNYDELYPQTLLSFVLPCRKDDHFAYIKDIERLERSVVVVKCGQSWGTGILVDEETGTFITCAHVITKAPEKAIELAARIGGNRSDKTEWLAQATLVYRTPADQPYDFAVLRVDPKFREPSLRAVKLADKPARKGERVCSIGFPFSAKSNATISSGVVSKTLRCMLQTSCCAQSGTSGGLIVRRSTHEMLGMLVCNTVSSSGTILYPRLSMAIPVTVFEDILSNYLKTSDTNALKALTEKDPGVEMAWKLRPFLSSNI